MSSLVFRRGLERSITCHLAHIQRTRGAVSSLLSATCARSPRPPFIISSQIARLIAIADQARRATAPDLLRLQDALHEALAEIIEAGRSDTTVLLAASHAQSMISWRQSLGEPDRAKASTLSALG